MFGKSQTQPENILIVRLGAMGDVLHAMPAVAALRKALPQADLTWVIERRWAELLQPEVGEPTRVNGTPLVDSMGVVDTKNWRNHPINRGTWKEITQFVRNLRASRFEVALDLQGAIKSALLAKASGASEIVGFASPRERMATIWYTSRVHSTAAHVIDQNLQLVSAIAGGVLKAEDIELPRSFDAEDWSERFLQKRGVAPFAILNPGSGWGAKSWPGERYGQVAKRLQTAGLQSVVNFGPGEDALAESVAASSDGAAETVTCTLAQLIALTRRASLFIGGDTGPMHLAAALKIPTVALFGPTDPARNGPYWKPSVILRSKQSMTSYKHVAQADPGLHAITADAVVAASAQLLGVPIG